MSKLTGMVRAQIQRVSMMRGAERWSSVMVGEVERGGVIGGRVVEEMGRVRRRIVGIVRHWEWDMRRGVSRMGRRIFSIC